MSDDCASPFEALRNPFPGLRPFQESDARWFYGRSQETRELLDRLTFHRFVAVMGSSGCGKSSLVRASLIPALRAGYHSDTQEAWRIVDLRPGADPVTALAVALVGTLAMSPEDPAGNVENVVRELHGGSLGIVRLLKDVGLPHGAKVLVLVDQFEELFTIAQRNRNLPDGEIRDFVQLLVDAAWSPDLPVHVLVTMRSENLGLCSRFGDLSHAINDGLFLVPKLPNHRLRDVIELPVERSIDPAVVTCLINGCGGATDDLPLLQHALMRLWEVRQRRDPRSPISMDDIERVGRIGETIGRQVEEILGKSEEAGGGEDRELAFSLFLEITEIGDDGQMNRQPKTFGDLCRRLRCDPGRLRQLIDRFRRGGCSFLQPSRADVVEIDEATLVDISHESLVRQWEDLRLRARELKQVRDDIELTERTAKNWVRHGKDADGLEPGGRRLQRAKELLSLRPLDFSEGAKEFVETSYEAAIRGARRRYFARVGVLAAALGFLVFLGISAYLNKAKDAKVAQALQAAAETAKIAAEAEQAKAQAEAARAQAEAARAQAEAAQAQARKEAVEAQIDAESERARAAKAEAEAARTRALAAENEKRIFEEADAAKALNAANERQLRELELVLQRERAEAELRSNKNREAMVSLVAVFYQSILGTREYPDAHRQLENFPASPIRYLGEEINPEQLREVVAFEAREWPIRKFTLLAKPTVSVEAGLSEAETVAYFHYEYRRGDRSDAAIFDGPAHAAGYFKETCRYRIGETLEPSIFHLDREPVGLAELREAIVEEFDRLRSDRGIAAAQIGEEIARNRFWHHELGFPFGTVLAAPALEFSGAGTVLSTGRVFRTPGGGGGAPRLIDSSLKVAVLNGDFDASEKVVDEKAAALLLYSFSSGSSSGSSAVVEVEGSEPAPPGQVSFPAGDPSASSRRPKSIAPPGQVSQPPGEVSHQGQMTVSLGFPWPASHKAIKEREAPTERDSALYAMLKQWESGAATPTEQVARAAGELYLICSNPNPIREQIDFFSPAPDGPEHLRSYYNQDKTFESVMKELENYKQKFPERDFQVIADSVVIVEPSEPEGNLENEVTVAIPFEFKHDSTSVPVKMATRATFLILPGRWPVITWIGSIKLDTVPAAFWEAGVDPSPVPLRDSGAPPGAGKLQVYEGDIGGKKAVFQLAWGQDRTVSGSYYFVAEKERIFILKGSNPKDGVLHLDEFDDGRLSARCELEKVSTDQQIHWQGKASSIDGRKLQMQFKRGRE